MPINYTLQNDARLIHAIADGRVTNENVVNFVTAIAHDKRIEPWADELFEIRPNCTVEVTYDGILKAIDQTENLVEKTKIFRCAIFIPHKDEKAWEMTKLYRAMAQRDEDISVISLFSDIAAAREWLKINDDYHV
jgi:hypothetical protein